MESVSNRTILTGDVIEKLRELPAQSIDTVISSPPYWNMRDYGIPGQWGLEDNFGEYLVKMGGFMEEVKRVLKDTGSVWINLGDSYMPDKSKVLMPERFAVMCRDNGWIVRNHIPWIKANAMPTSVKDRFKNMWESILFFVKQPHYYFDLDAVRTPSKTDKQKPWNRRIRDAKKLRQMGLDGAILMAIASDSEIENYEDSRNKPKQDMTLDGTGNPNPMYKGFNERWNKTMNNITGDDRKRGRTSRVRTFHDLKHNVPGQPKQGIKKNRENGLPDFNTIKWDIVPGQSKQTIANHLGHYDYNGKLIDDPKGSNPGDVFFINPKPFVEAHFATFPVELPERIILCACPPDGIVLDPFFGAGTVGIAAEKLGRKWIGIDINEKYVDLAKKRLAKYQNEGIDSFF